MIDFFVPVSLMNRLRFTATLPATAPSALATLLVDAAQRPPWPVSQVLVVADLVPTSRGLLRLRGGPGLGEHVPVREVFTRVGCAPLLHHVRHFGDQRGEDERQSGVVDRVLVGIRDHPRVSDDGDSGELVDGHEGLMTGSMVLVVG